MGAMSLVKVTSPVVGAGACAVVPTVAVTSEASSRPKSPKIPGTRCFDITTSSGPTVSRFLGKTSVIPTPGRLNTQLQGESTKIGDPMTTYYVQGSAKAVIVAPDPMTTY